MPIKSWTGFVLSFALLGCTETRQPCEADPAAVFCPAFTEAAACLSQADKAALIAAGEWPRGTEVSVEGRQFLEFDAPVRQFFESCGLGHPEMMGAPFNEGLAEYLRGQRVDMHQICARYKTLMIPPPPPPDPRERSNSSGS